MSGDHRGEREDATGGNACINFIGISIASHSIEVPPPIAVDRGGPVLMLRYPQYASKATAAWMSGWVSG